MHGIIKKKIGSIFLLLAFSTTCPAEEPWYNTLVSQYPVQCCIAGATTALIIGKLSYNYYTSHQPTPDQCIETCRSNYKQIYKSVENYHIFYQSDVKMSDWDLKGLILDNNQEPYPFMAYYTSLTKTSWILHKHLLTLTTQLTEIDKHIKQLANNKSEATDHLREMFFHLKTEGKLLQEYTTRTIMLITILKNRTQLFKEYKDDCRNWSQTKRNKLP